MARSQSAPHALLAALIAMLALAAGGLAQQTRPVPDVGLTLDLGATLPAFVGYDCGTFSCQPFDAGNFTVGSVRTFTAFGAPLTPYAIALGLPAPCRPLPPLGNALLLGPPLGTLRVGMIGPHLSGLNCNQGMDRFRFTMPRTAPTGIAIRFQSIGVGAGGILAFGPAIDVRIS